MEATLALWFDPTAVEEPTAPILELHVNLWRGRYDDLNFLDVGLKLSEVADLERFHLYFPAPIGREHIADLAVALRQGATLKAVFNGLVEAESGGADWYPTTQDGRHHLTVHMVDVEADLRIEPVDEGATRGVEITFGERLCERMRNAAPGDQYVRIRFELDGVADDLFTSEVASGDRWFASATSLTEITEFRINERRSYPHRVARRSARDQFRISRIHYFLMRDVETQLGSQHSQFSNVRRLEADLWRPYLEVTPSGRAPSHLRRGSADRLVAYHWSRKAEQLPGKATWEPIPSFSAFASFRGARPHVAYYVAGIVLLGSIGSAISALLVARLGTSAKPGDARADLEAAAILSGLLALLVAGVEVRWRSVGQRASIALARLRRRR